MNKVIFLIFFLIFSFNLNAKENMMILKLKDGDVKIELFEDKAPNHVKRIKELADKGLYDNVVFHRVIDGFMAQVGDVQFGNSSSDNFDLNRAGTGGSDLPNLKAEFNDIPQIVFFCALNNYLFVHFFICFSSIKLIIKSFL